MKVTGIGSGSGRRGWSRLAAVVAFLTALAITYSGPAFAPDVLRGAHAEEREGDFERGFGNRRFSERDIRGPYGFFFQGFVTVALPDASSLPVPVSAVGHLVADGRGQLPEGSRTLNFGGIVLEQEAEGSYEVRPDGTGTATIEVTIPDQTGAPPTGLELPMTTIETFSFVITNRAAGIPFIGRSILNAESGEPVGAVTIRGEAHRQR